MTNATDLPTAEPVAVVGLGCRLPGDVHGPEQFWDLLGEQRSTVGDVPWERWAPYAAHGAEFTSAMRRAIARGNFITGIEEFDTEFFGITPREAELMDPQQRILLEVTWEALEHAGIVPRTLAGTDAGVFVGLCSGDYGSRLLEDLPGIEAWTGIGAASCGTANRISHVLDLRGPSIAVDTACSASLVAVHLACQSLRLAESTVAIAAGVNLIASPGQSLTLGAAGALAPDGRSKPFDAGADGYGRGEGCGVVVLKLLRDAEHDGDRVLAVIRGSAVNQDGHTNGIMAPCGAAQEHVMVRACAQAGIDPATVDYVEAHGTGTRLGDPMEAGAISAVYGAGRAADEPCLVGSVKSNIGHLEGAAGVASVIKATLALQHAVVPASLLHTELNPEIPWADSGLRLAASAQQWPRRPHPRRAGVSGFGYGGTVAHIVMEQAPQTTAEPDRQDDDEVRLYPLSAVSGAALRQAAAELADHVSSRPEVPLAAVGGTLARHRSHQPHRAGIVAGGREELVTGLRLLAEDRPAKEVVTDVVRSGQGRGLVWVFSGHGSHWSGMGRELLATEPEFAKVIDVLDPVFAAESGFTARELIHSGIFETVDRIQPMIFAMQVGLAAMWRSRGVVPGAVIGHSMGEVAAAVTCGLLSLEDGARVSCWRSRLLTRAEGKGDMVMVSLPFDQAAQRLAGRTDLSPAIAASPVSTVLAGDLPAVQDVLDTWPGEGIQARRVSARIAFHSPHMDPLLEELTQLCAGLRPARPAIPMYSTALPDPRAVPPGDGRYWATNLRQPVRLAAAVAAAAEDGFGAFLEVSAHPLIAHSVGETLAEQGMDEAFAGISLRRNRPELRTYLAAVAAAHCAGIDVDWSSLQPGGSLTDLPGTAWQRRRLWRETSDGTQTRQRGHDVDSYTLLGTRQRIAGSPIVVWRTGLDDGNRPYPGSHALNGVEIVPASVLVSTFMAAGADGRPAHLDRLVMRQPLITNDYREIQVVRDGGALRLASRSPGGDTWLINAQAEIRADVDVTGGPIPAGTGDAAEFADPGLIRERLASVGVPATGFEWTVERLRRGTAVLVAEVKAPHGRTGAESWAVAFDAVMSIAPAVFPGPPLLRMAVDADLIAVGGDAPDTVTVTVVLADERLGITHAVVADAAGRRIARVDGLRYTELGGSTPATDARRALHTTVWRAPDTAAERPAARTVVLVGPALAGLAGGLASAGVTCHAVHDAAGLGDLSAHLDESAEILVSPVDHVRPVSVATRRAQEQLDAVADAVCRLPQERRPRLWCLTSGVRDSSHSAHTRQATLWGLVRALRAGHPGLRVGTVDLGPSWDGSAAEALLAALDRAADEDVVALDADGPAVPRLTRVDLGDAGAPPPVRADSTYAVVGAFTPAGAAAAHWLAGLGAGRLVLLDAEALPPRSEWDSAGDLRPEIATVRALEARGVAVFTGAADVAAWTRDGGLVPAVWDLPPVRGVVYAPGRDARDSLAVIDWLHATYPPQALDLMLFAVPLEARVSPGPGDPSAAVASYADSLTAHRVASGCRGTWSISWPAGDLPGTAAVDAGLLFEAAGHALGQAPGVYAVVSPTAEDAPRPPLLAALTVEEATADAGAADAGGPGSVQLDSVPPDELRRIVADEADRLIAGEMRLSAGELDRRRPLVEQGMDSVMTVVVRRRLQQRFGHDLPTTLLWQQPTVTAIAAFITELLLATRTVADDDEILAKGA
ncbi:beta-ketoacyl synthase N-terminal-like domain-containing protein [Dactylosporangium sp. NPDC050588]|uniref:Putative iterative type I polyketide synthase n=1 Tax=Dactylosporangium aurantiacum subsp. hamdenensis TaxID=703577 RepID=E9LIN0_9ACTN|nr:putative iterative type I polyketide synthase [Dactylosporangium aurantiacum subsp. hamdenensis]